MDPNTPLLQRLFTFVNNNEAHHLKQNNTTCRRIDTRSIKKRENV